MKSDRVDYRSLMIVGVILMLMVMLCLTLLYASVPVNPTHSQLKEAVVANRVTYFRILFWKNKHLDESIILDIAYESVIFSRTAILDVVSQHIDLSDVELSDHHPLGPACVHANAKMVNHLIKKGVSVNIRNPSNGQTALHMAVGNSLLIMALDPVINDFSEPIKNEDKYAEIVNILLENGADPDVLDNYGDSPLHIAAYGGRLLIVKELIAHGADMHIKNVDGKTPLDLAMQEDEQGIVRYLKSIQ